MSECRYTNDSSSALQSDAPMMNNDGSPHFKNDGDMKQAHDTATNFEALSSNNHNIPPPHSSYYPHRAEESAAPSSWGGNPPNSNNNNVNYPHVPPVPPPPHMNMTYPPKGHEPRHRHGGYPPYGTAPHYHHYPPHESHYHPMPPPHHAVAAAANHYPAPQMYHPPPHYYPPPQYHHYATMPPPHAMPPPPPTHVTYPPQYSMPTSEVTPNANSHVYHNDTQSGQVHTAMKDHTQQQPQQQVNMVTPSIDNANTPATTFANDTTLLNVTPNNNCTADNNNEEDDDMSIATKQLFSYSPPNNAQYSCREGQMQPLMNCNESLPLNSTTNSAECVDDSLLLPTNKNDVTTLNPVEMVRASNNGVNDMVNHPSATLSKVAAQAANTALQLSNNYTYKQQQYDGNTTTKNINSSTNNTSTTNNNNSVTSPHQIAELQSISHQARAHIAKFRSSKKLSLQEESWKVADIASVDVPFAANGAGGNGGGNGGGGGLMGSCTDVTALTDTNNGKSEEGRKKGMEVIQNRHYKKLFEKGLVPKVTTTTGGVDTSANDVKGGNDDVSLRVVHPPTNQVLSEKDTRPEEKREEHMELPRPRSHQTQVLYPHQPSRHLNSSDGYELRVIPTEDGNDFHVELVQPDDSTVVKSIMKTGEKTDGEEVSSLTSMESDKSGSGEGAAAATAGGGEGGSQKNGGEFDCAVDSILDAAETIAKRDTPRSSPVAVPNTQKEPLNNSCDEPAIASSMKRKHDESIQDDLVEKRQRSDSGNAVKSCIDPTMARMSSNPSLATIRPSPQQEAGNLNSSPSSNSVVPAPSNAYSQIICQDRKERRGSRTYCFPNPSVDLTTYYSSKQVTKTDKEELTALALCAASHIKKEPVLFRAILLNMALERERNSQKRGSGGAPTHLKNLALKRLSSQMSDASDAADVSFLSELDSSGKKVIRDGFFWKDVPELEKVLRQHMMEYYFMSENRPQSKKQQQFNNRLVSLVYQEAVACGFVFDPLSFSLEGHSSLDLSTSLDFGSANSPSDGAANSSVPSNFNHKKLRDRIRCYYKTHVQNSKKRLGTLLKNPMKERNRDILLKLVKELNSQEHVELSSECTMALKRLKSEQDSIVGIVSSPNGASTSSSYETESRRPSVGFADDQSQQQATTPHSSRTMISDGGSGSSSNSAQSVHFPEAVNPPAPSVFSPFKHASLLSSMRQLDSQRH